MRESALDPRKPYKPLDVGNGIVSGTLGPNGRWLSLGVAHPVHGRVVLTAAPPFSGERHDQRAVRVYRAGLAAPDHETFGLVLPDGAVTAFRTDDEWPLSVIDGPQARVDVKTIAPRGRTGAVQLVRLRAHEAIAGPTFTGNVRLARAEYTQLTEGGPLPPAPTDPRSALAEGLFWIEDERLGAAAAIAWSAPRSFRAGELAPAGLAIAFGADRSAAADEARLLLGDERLAWEVDARRKYWSGLSLGGEGDAAVRRGVAYALDCAASRVDDAVAILADHVILPLVWTRDAYYVCRALLAVGAHEPLIASTIEGFARWLFERAERPDGWWPRASLASGQVKDRAFQLDQQLWPLLLVADSVRLSGGPAVSRYGHACTEMLDALLAKRSAFGLIATAETPADDPLKQPYHFSSHVLLWRVLDAFGHPAAREVRDATLRHFTSEGRFAYAVAGPDGESARHYHDANDFPTVFAPGWAFCPADDPRWRATIEFAWSVDNEGYFGSALAGLGSLHTPHPWPLGDLQEIVVARVRHDPARERRARERLQRVETWDGMLPEAYDETTGAVASRHHFAWPVALRALLERDPMLTAP
jgi:hypothetical protein